MITDRKLERLFDEWSHIADMCVHMAKRSHRMSDEIRREFDALCVKRDEAWKKYELAAQAAQYYEQEAKHDESMQDVRETNDD